MKSRPDTQTLTGFTFIELLISLAVLAVLFLPVMQLFSQSLYATSYSRELITATNLAKWQMEKIKNLSYTKEQLKKIGDAIYPELSASPIEMNGLNWRIKREIVKETDPLEIRITVYKEGEPDNSLVSLVTLMEDRTWIVYEPIK